MIKFYVNNGGQFTLQQDEPDGNVKVQFNDDTEDFIVSAGDFTMLLNYYRYVVDNDIQCDFLNPYGKNKR